MVRRRIDLDCVGRGHRRHRPLHRAGCPRRPTVTATSIADPTKSASASIVVSELVLSLAPSAMVVAPGKQRQLRCR